MSRLSIGRDTTLCMSLSARPGTFGSRFHNHLFAALSLDYVYKAFSTQDLPAAISGIRALGIRGCAVSMPFKEACIPLLDELAPSAARIQSVNTIVHESGRLIGHNTDYAAVRALIAELGLASDAKITLRGSGGMAKAVAHALAELGFGAATLVARNRERGEALAQATGLAYRAKLALDPQALLINATPLGMAGAPEAQERSFPEPAIARAESVFDVVAQPVETPLIRAARGLGKRVITGGQVLVLQGLEQFVLYTGLRPNAQQLADAAAFALR
ncbi:MAG TPA: shikimate 5-dehydrogenase [Polyangiales bacterium]